MKSEKFSFKGWRLKEWLKGNFSTIKEIAKVGMPLLITWSTTHSPGWTALITVCCKLAIDSLEYYCKSY